MISITYFHGLACARAHTNTSSLYCIRNAVVLQWVTFNCSSFFVVATVVAVCRVHDYEIKSKTVQHINTVIQVQ